MLPTAIQIISRILAVVSALATLIIMVLTVLDVVSRLAGGGSVPGLLELSEVALVFLVYCGIAYGQQKRIHVSVSLLTSKLPERTGRAVVVVGLLFVLVIFGWATYATGTQAIESVLRGEVRFGITKVPIWPARLVIPVGFLLLIGEVLIQLLHVLQGREQIRGEEPISEEELSA